MNKYYFFLASLVLLLASCSQEKTVHIVDVKTYHIQCDSIAFDSIHDNFKENIYLSATVTSQEEQKQVKMRLRGDSSREYPKKSLKIKVLDGAQLAQKTIFNFNAEYKDPSFSHSYFSSLVFKKLNYPCFSSSMAKIYVNDKFHGLFLEIENMDKDFLIRNGLNTKGDLYKATKDGACLYSATEVDRKWEKKSNKKSSWAPLFKLIEDLQEVSDEDFETYIKANFHYAYLVDYLAANIFIANGSTNYHNYYLYRDAENNGKWMLIPWDLDKSLSYYNWKPFAYHSTSSDWENDNPLIERCYLNSSISKDVKQRLLSFKDVLGPEFYEPIYTAIESTLQNSVLEDKTDKVNSKEAWTKAINRELKFLKNRPDKALKSMEAFPRSFRVHTTASQLSTPFYLTWDKAIDSNQVNYEVYLSKDFLYEDSISTMIYKTADNSIKIDEDLALGTYHWKVVAVKNGLKCDGFNSKNSFELREGTVLPTLISASTNLNNEGSPYRINDSLIIEKNAVLNVEEGVVLLANHNAKIKVFGGLNLNGSAEEIIELRPIKPNGYFHSINFYSNNIECNISNALIKEGCVVGESCKLSIRNTRFEIDKRIPQVRENGPCVIWVKGGDINIDSIQLYGNKNGQGMNILSATASVTNSSFVNIPDAIEYINVVGGVIENNYIMGSPDDAIDLNGCENVVIKGNTIINSKDKGVSIGGASERLSTGVLILNNYIFNNGIALSVKDSSIVISEGNFYAYNKLGLQAYLKNTWYSKMGGLIYSTDDIFIENSQNEYIDQYSNIDTQPVKMHWSIFKDNTTYFIPSEITYEIVNGVVNIYNNSFFDVNLNDWILLVDDGAVVVNFTKNERIPSKGFLQISQSKLNLDQYSNYLLSPSIEISAKDHFSLQDIDGNKYELNRQSK